MVSEYQVSGLPFAITGSTSGQVAFPYVTQWIMLKAVSGSLTVGFTEAGLNGVNHFAVASAGGFTVPLYWKVKELWVSGSAYEIAAGLTMVPPNKMWNYVHPPASGSVNGPFGDFTAFGYNGI